MKSLSVEDGDLFLTHEIIQLGYAIHEVETIKQTNAYTVYMDLARKDREMIYKLIEWIKQIDDSKKPKR